MSRKKFNLQCRGFSWMIHHQDWPILSEILVQRSRGIDPKGSSCLSIIIGTASSLDNKRLPGYFKCNE
jgi:hypothetical protein